jgi:GT2 family glycosyltransferase
MAIDVSIIIVNFNSTEYLRNCLDSIYQFTSGLEYEVLVVDNGSTDNSFGQLHELERITRRSIIVNEENKGFGVANNMGAKIAKGKYLLFLNPDTELIDNSVLELFNFMEQSDKSIAACGARLQHPDSSYSVSFGNLPSLFQQFSDIGFRRLYMKFYNQRLSISPPCDFTQPAPVGYISGADLFIRKEIFNQLGGFDEDYFMYYEDTDLCKRLQRSEYETYIVPSVTVLHAGSETPGAFNYDKYRMLERSKYLYFRKHHGRFSSLLARTIQILTLLVHAIPKHPYRVWEAIKITVKV